MAEHLALQICTFLIWTLGVAGLTWLFCRYGIKNRTEGAGDDYFAGGRALKWYICAGSLMLTNLSTEQLVGLNGTVFADGCLCGIWWEAGAAIAMIVTATVFLPRFFALGLTTTSGFLGERYDLTLRTMVSCIFMVYYAVVLCPLVLYTGALAVKDIFDLSVPLWVVSLVIGLLGAVYALTGGLKAVAVSDCLNGIGLIIAGFWVPIAAINALPNGLSTLFEDGSELLKPLVERSWTIEEDEVARAERVPSVPWHVNLTGLLLTNMYYWSTNQVIMQRVLAAESLSNGQKGVLFAAMMKVVGFALLCIPGIVGILLQAHGVTFEGEAFVVEKPDEVYSTLVKAVMPKWSLGFFAAVLLGSVLSTFNSALNSASTIFGLEIYKIYFNKEATDAKVIKVSTVFGVGLTLLSFVIAPQLVHVGTIFNFLQLMNSIISLPIVTVFFVGIAASLPDAFAGKVGFVVAFVTICAGQAIPDLQFLHLFFICFVLASSTIALFTYVPALRTLCKREAVPETYVCDKTGVVDMTPWKPMYFIAAAILVLLVMLICSLQFASFGLHIAFWVCWFLVLAALMWFRPVVGLIDAGEGEAKGKEVERKADGGAAKDEVAM
mmetsp:Transcript_70011/g.146386  ORF Transcript_70011/g.146386 Transcript_70011/m.146386 type:complete len:607 (+) Transcript_70011:131-1951(+)